MNPLKKLLGALTWHCGAWWPNRRVSVEREDPTTDVVTIRISDVVQARILTRNDVFSTAAVAYAMLVQAIERGSPVIRSFSITYTPHGKEPQVVKVPDWAVRPLFQRLFAVACELGWQGQCPRPHADSAFR